MRRIMSGALNVVMMVTAVAGLFVCGIGGYWAFASRTDAGQIRTGWLAFFGGAILVVIGFIAGAVRLKIDPKAQVQVPESARPSARDVWVIGQLPGPGGEFTWDQIIWPDRDYTCPYCGKVHTTRALPGESVTETAACGRGQVAIHWHVPSGF